MRALVTGANGFAGRHLVHVLVEDGYEVFAAAGPVGTDTKTSVGELSVGSDLQFIDNPGEAFPGLMIGSPWGVEEAGCPNRPNPPAHGNHVAT